jgi:serine/threonine-protein kinase
MAAVWCAHDRTLDRRVAIKLLSEPYAHDQLAGRRFMREARAAARLSGHANVVTIYDVGRALSGDSSPGRPFMVMEFLPGGTVADALRTGELDQAVVITWLRQAAAALDYAHRRGVIHRDVKLSNFLLDHERELHVADFGIAQLGTEDTLSSRGEVLGTAAYLAPERALGLPATEAADRYGLAVAAYELLVGERPFTAQGFAAQARQHVEEPPPRASAHNGKLPAAIDAVLARGMAKQQDRRYGTAQELVDAIEHALSGDRKKPAALPERVSPPPVSIYGSHGRGRIAALAALTAVLFGVAIAAAATLLPGGSHPRLTARTHAVYAQHRTAQRTTTHAAADLPRTTSTASSPTTSTPASAPPQPTSPPPTAATLEAQGHQLMVAGNYQAAIPVLRRATGSAPHSSLTYAYALYDLGRSLRLAGDPRAAVAVLWRRLQIPNQTDVVRYELTLALEALGQSQGSGGGVGPLASRSAGPRHRHGGDGSGSGQGD